MSIAPPVEQSRNSNREKMPSANQLDPDPVIGQMQYLPLKQLKFVSRQYTTTLGNEKNLRGYKKWNDLAEHDKNELMWQSTRSHDNLQYSMSSIVQQQNIT
jgi:hypothetical protein